MLVQIRNGKVVIPAISQKTKSLFVKVSSPFLIAYNVIKAIVLAIVTFLFIIYAYKARIFGAAFMTSSVYGISYAVDDLFTGLVFGTIIPTIILLQYHYPKGQESYNRKRRLK